MCRYYLWNIFNKKLIYTMQILLERKWHSKERDRRKHSTNYHIKNLQRKNFFFVCFMIFLKTWRCKYWHWHSLKCQLDRGTIDSLTVGRERGRKITLQHLSKQYSLYADRKNRHQKTILKYPLPPTFLSFFLSFFLSRFEPHCLSSHQSTNKKTLK